MNLGEIPDLLHKNPVTYIKEERVTMRLFFLASFSKSFMALLKPDFVMSTLHINMKGSAMLESLGDISLS